MAKPRRMLSDLTIPAIDALFALIPTQSKLTVGRWAVGYAEHAFLPIWTKHFPDDERPKNALAAARECLGGKIKIPELKTKLAVCMGIAHDADGNPAAQAAVRAIVDCGAGAAYNPSKSIGIALYGALAVAYDTVGVTATRAEQDEVAVRECDRILAALQSIAVEDEPNPCKVSWEC